MLFLISYDKLNCRKIKQVSFKKYKCIFLFLHHYNDHQHNNFENRKGTTCAPKVAVRTRGKIVIAWMNSYFMFFFMQDRYPTKLVKLVSSATLRHVNEVEAKGKSFYITVHFPLVTLRRTTNSIWACEDGKVQSYWHPYNQRGFKKLLWSSKLVSFGVS